MKLSRRSFLGSYAALHFGGLPNLLYANTVSGKRILTVLLRGGLDGLYVLPPIFDKNLDRLRPVLLKHKYEKISSDFRISSLFPTISELYSRNQALFVHASSFPYTGRSHFDGQNIMETGILTPYASKTGWLGRLLEAQGHQDEVDALGLSLPIPLILRGSRNNDNFYPSFMPPALNMVLENLKPAYASNPSMMKILDGVVSRERSLTLRTTTKKRHIGLADLAIEAAKRLNMDDGPRVAVLDHLGFDTHANAPFQSDSTMSELDNAIRVFKNELSEDVWNKTYIVTVTEFGRTAAENSGLGTEHGYASLVMVLGGALQSGGIIADWPGLKQSELFQGRDLMATIDSRSVYGSVMRSYLNTDHDFVRRNILDYPINHKLDSYI